MRTFKIILLVLITLIILCIAGIYFIKSLSINIEQTIKQANYCSTTKDCILTPGKCPLGCHIYINKKEKDKIRKLLDSFNSSCEYDECGEMLQPICIENKCQPETKKIKQKTNINITNFEECINAGNMALLTYPMQCRANGKIYYENIGNALKKLDLIWLGSPISNERITSPLIISGKAKGEWFSDGFFPVSLINADGKVITQGIVRAKENWKTDKFIEFEGEIKFKQPSTNTGTLILKKGNLSGLPENDDALERPIKFQ